MQENETQEANAQQSESAFVLPPEKPTQEAVNGICFDFNMGLRIAFPNEGEYRCLFRDLDSGLILYCMDTQPNCMIVSIKKFFVNFALEVYEKKNLDKAVFVHELNLKDKEVLIQLPEGALGDTIAWFSYVERFQKKHSCKLYCLMSEEIAELFKKEYPNISFVNKKEAALLQPYATYRLGLFFGGDTDNQPYDFRYVGLHRTAAHILGLEDLSDVPPKVDLSAKRQIQEKYVVIATQASSQCKYWNNPSGWREVIAHLKELGYRVLCIDRESEYGIDYFWNKIPWGCEDFTGRKSLQERINLIKDAEMFIGLSSGLSWLAWCCKVPVVLISGFTEPNNEFFTPYRVINPQACHGCWNDARYEFDHKDFFWCPRKNNDSERFECTKAITGKLAIKAIDKAIKRRLEQ